MKKILYYICNPKKAMIYLMNKNFFWFLTDKVYLKLKFRLVMGEKLNLRNPQTFNEKLQWLKLYNRKDIYTTMVDKIKAKEYIANTVGEQYLIPTIGVYDNVDNINFDNLPNQFVIKCNHNSGLGMYICKDKSKLDVKKVKKELKKGLSQNYYLTSREWPYKNVQRRIIIEQFLTEQNSECLTDYKFFCFNGIPKIMYISKDFAEKPTTDFFDMNFKYLKIKMKDDNSKVIPSKPEKFDEMKKIAKKLSRNIPFLRVDMYYINNNIYIGELTFFHNSGMVRISPKEYEKILGDYIDITNII